MKDKQLTTDNEHERLFREPPPQSSWLGGLAPDHSDADARRMLAREHSFGSFDELAEHLEVLRRTNSPVTKFETAVDAVVAGEAIALERLLQQNPELLHARSARKHRATLLHYVGANGVEGWRQRTPRNAVQVAEILLKAGAEVDAMADMYGGSTTLGLVAISTHPLLAGVQNDLIEALLNHGAAMDHPQGAGNGQGIVNGCLANGEFLALVKADGTTVASQFSPRFANQRRNVSYGVGADTGLHYFRPPTPGAANGTNYVQFVADTKFSVDRGFYDAPLSVTITSATANATIYYTTAWTNFLALCSQGLASGAAYQRVQGNNPDGTPNPAYPNYLDVDQMADYLIALFYGGTRDWPAKNYWLLRHQTNNTGFKFMAWDAEMSLGLLVTNANFDSTGFTTDVAAPYGAARANAEFRLRFADRVHKHFFNGGAFHIDPNQPQWDPSHPERNRPAARFAALAAAIDSAMVAESARWGDQHAAIPYTRDEHWRVERDRVLNYWIPDRSSNVLQQFRAAGLYPNFVAPSFNQHGGAMPTDFQLVMSAPAGAIYYTVNGGESLVLRDGTSTVLDVAYGTDAPWPASADGAGNSLELIDWNGDFHSPANWRASLELGGTPGRVLGAVLRVESIRLEGQRVILRFMARAGARYTLSFKSDLSAPNWNPLTQLPPAAVPGSREFEEAIPPTGQQRYYWISSP